MLTYIVLTEENYTYAHVKRQAAIRYHRFFFVILLNL